MLRKEFQPAKLLVKQSAESVAKLVEQKSYPGAAIQLQSLIAQELSEPQREAVSAALQTVNQKLQEQAAVLEPAAAGEAAAPPVPAAKAEEAAAAAAVMERYKQTK